MLIIRFSGYISRSNRLLLLLLLLLLLFMNIYTKLVLQYKYCYQYRSCCLIKNVKNYSNISRNLKGRGSVKRKYDYKKSKNGIRN